MLVAMFFAGAFTVLLIAAIVGRLSGRVCVHRWEPWKYRGTITIYASRGDDMPVRKLSVQERTCTKCGKTISRKYRA